MPAMSITIMRPFIWRRVCTELMMMMYEWVVVLVAVVVWLVYELRSAPKWDVVQHTTEPMRTQKMEDFIGVFMRCLDAIARS